MHGDTPFGSLVPGGKRGFDEQLTGAGEIGFDRGQRRSAEFARTQSVESNDADVAGNGEVACGEFLQRPQRHGVAGEEKSVERGARFDQLADCIAPLRYAIGAAADDGFSGSEPGRFHRFAIAFVAFAELALRRCRIADEDDLLRPAPDKPIDRQPATCAIVRSHPDAVVEGRTPEGHPARGLGAGGKIIPCGAIGRRPDHHHSVGLTPRDIMAKEFVGLCLEGHQRFIASLGRGGAGAAQQAVVEWIDRCRAFSLATDHHDGDGPRLAATQAGRARIDLIAEFLGRALDPAAGRFGDGFGSRQGPADSRLADPRPLGDIDRCHCPRPGLVTAGHARKALPFVVALTQRRGESESQASAANNSRALDLGFALQPRLASDATLR